MWCGFVSGQLCNNRLSTRQAYLALIQLWITIWWTIRMEQVDNPRKTKKEEQEEQKQKEEEGLAIKPIPFYFRASCLDLF